MDADDVPRWSPKAAVRKEDQFTAAPDFIDVHESDHLPLWGRLGASWHGMGPQRRVLVAASLIVFAGAAGALTIFTLSDLGAPEDASQGGLAAEDGAGPVQSVPDAPRAVDDLLNATSSPPLPKP